MAPQRRRRAVGPAGSRPPEPEPRLDESELPAAHDDAADERLRAERPPHHDRER